MTHSAKTVPYKKKLTFYSKALPFEESQICAGVGYLGVGR